MNRIFNLLAIFLAGAVLPTPPPPLVATSLDTPPAERLPAVVLSPEEVDAVEWARERFVRVGLDLPEMVIEFDPTKAACGNAEGKYRFDGERHFLAICTRPGAAFRADLERRRTLLHEFAHAWETVNLDESDRAGLLADLGVARWHDPDARWEDRGAERFAEILVFALLDQPLRQLKAPGECSTMVALFVRLTGHEPLGPAAPACL